MKIIQILFILVVFTGRISSYKPGIDGHSGTRLAGARCLNLPKKYWDYKPNYPVPVCAMRAGKTKGQVRFGDIAEVVIKKKGIVHKHACVVLDGGPYGCLDLDNGWHNCGPKTLYAGKLPKGWKWKSQIDVAHPPKGFPTGRNGKVRVFHALAGVDTRRQMVLDMIKGKTVIFKHKTEPWKRKFKF